MKTDHLLHRNGGRIKSLVAIAHSTYKKCTEWHFLGTCEWSDNSHQRDPARLYHIAPYALVIDDSDPESKGQCDHALKLLAKYLLKHGKFAPDGGGWIPRRPEGREEIAVKQEATT